LKEQLKTKINMEMEWKILQGNFLSWNNLFDAVIKRIFFLWIFKMLKLVWKLQRFSFSFHSLFFSFSFSIIF
jgi:hypothetical protein